MARSVAIEDIAADAAVPRPLRVVVDRLVVRGSEAREQEKRATDSIEQAFRFGKGTMALVFPESEQVESHSEDLTCTRCGAADAALRDPVPNLFSFNSPLGACEACRGFGRIIDVDLDLVIPDPSKSLKDGAIKPWSTKSTEWERGVLARFCRGARIPMDVPFADLTAAQRRRIVEGEGKFHGIRGWFRWLEGRTYKMHVRVFLARYRSYRLCPTCDGGRLKAEALNYRIGGRTIVDLHRMSVSAVAAFFDTLELSAQEAEIAHLILGEIRSRIGYLLAVGLDYLALDRQSRTLSGGELARVDLTRAVGSSLVNTLYVLDEPSVGLHPARQPEAGANSPGAALQGKHRGGGRARGGDHPRGRPHRRSGPPRRRKGGAGDVRRPVPPAAVGAALRDRRLPHGPQVHRAAATPPYPELEPAHRRARRQREQPAQRQRLDPIGRLVCVTGVSGSGKSTLIEGILYRAIKKHRGEFVAVPGEHDEIVGAQHVRDVVMVDQSALGSTRRGNPGTYLKAFDPIRKIFAAASLAKLRGYTAATFSFNVAGGRCEACAGEGFETIEMQFLSDVYVTCPSLRGIAILARGARSLVQGQVDSRRPRSDGRGGGAVSSTRRPKWPRSCAGAHRRRPRLSAPRPAAQHAVGRRVAAFQAGRRMNGQTVKTHTLFLFDEPTIGLHFATSRSCWARCSSSSSAATRWSSSSTTWRWSRSPTTSSTSAPKGGAGGGEVVAAGTPDEVAACAASHTGRYLKQALTAAPATPLDDDGAAAAVAEAPAGGYGDANGRVDGHIRVVGAKEHNLRDISIDLPRDRFIVVTGLSGSGKSTLAFDIIYAEGQRRYLDSLSTYARQYVKILPRPNVDLLAGVPATVAIEQRLSRGSKKSTVATVTEIYHYLRLLYAKIGIQHCTRCDRPLSSLTREQIVRRIQRHYKGETVTLLAPAVRGRKGIYKDLFQAVRKLGFRRARIDGEIVPLREVPSLARYKEHDIDIVVGQVTMRGDSRAQLDECVATAQRLGGGAVVTLGGAGEQIYSERLYCTSCGVGYEELDPRLFSFNSRQGACPTCDGLGTTVTFEPASLIADFDEPLGTALHGGLDAAGGKAQRLAKKIAKSHRVPLDRPYAKLTPRKRKAFFDGNGKPGLVEALHGLMEEDEDAAAGLLDLLSERPCADCRGTRLNERARAVRVLGRAIWEVTADSVADAYEALARYRFSKRDAAIADNVMKEILPRLRFLREVGLPYLTLDRRADTLSGGEAQRIRLAAQLGSNLRGVCYILDEPTIGLHPRDNAMLIGTLTGLVDKGNTLLVVEHDEATIAAADLVVDLGPGGGSKGGQLVAVGTPRAGAADEGSVTGRYLGRRRGPAHGAARSRRGAATVDPRRTRAQSARHRRRAAGRRLDLRHRRLRLGQVDAGQRRVVRRPAPPTRPRRRSRRRPRPLRGLRGPQPHHRGRSDSDRAHAALHTGFLRRFLRRDPQAVRDDAGGAQPRLQGEPLLVQRQGRTLRGVRRAGTHQDGDELPARRLCRLRHLRRRALQQGNARCPVRRPQHRRGAGDDDRGRRGVLLRGAEGRQAVASARRHRPRLSDARAGQQHPVGRRGAAYQARLRARQGVAKRHAVRAGRTDHRPALRRRRQADRRPAPSRRPGQHRSHHRAQPRHHQRSRLDRRPGTRRRRGWRTDRGNGHGRRGDADQAVTHRSVLAQLLAAVEEDGLAA
jgi:excinuclease ABC subunit A